MTAGARKIPLAEQIAEVSIAIALCEASGAHIDAPNETRLARLHAVKASLEWLRRHEATIRDAVAGAAPDGRRRLKDLGLGQQAALRCQDARFRAFLNRDAEQSVLDADGAARELRARLGVRSRAEFDSDADAAARWRALDADYRAWLDCGDG